MTDFSSFSGFFIADIGGRSISRKV